MVAGVHGLLGQHVQQHVAVALRAAVESVTALPHSTEEGNVLETPLRTKYATDRSALLMVVFQTLALLELSAAQLLVDPGNVVPALMVTVVTGLSVKMSMSVIWCQICVIRWVAYSNV